MSGVARVDAAAHNPTRWQVSEYRSTLCTRTEPRRPRTSVFMNEPVSLPQPSHNNLNFQQRSALREEMNFTVPPESPSAVGSSARRAPYRHGAHGCLSVLLPHSESTLATEHGEPYRVPLFRMPLLGEHYFHARILCSVPRQLLRLPHLRLLGKP